MKLPFNSVRVGPYDVVIKPIADSEPSDVYGLFNDSDMSISIRPTIASKQLMADTLLHEVLHALWAVLHLPPREVEERAVSSLATELAQVIRDNPEIVAWLQKAVKK